MSAPRKTAKRPSTVAPQTGLEPEVRALPPSPAVELFGHITLVEGYDLPGFKGAHALLALRDTPGQTVAVLTHEPRLQCLLETALATGYLVDCWSHRLTHPPTPRGGTWSVDVYGIDGVILYNGV